MGTGYDKIIVENHGERISVLERGLSQLGNQVLPVLARLETAVTLGFQRMEERLDDGEKRFEKYDKVVSEIRRDADARDEAVKVWQKEVELLKAESDRRKAFYSKLFKILTPIASAVLIAAILAFLKLSKN
jgi:hypothetical protein